MPTDYRPVYSEARKEVIMSRVKPLGPDYEDEEDDGFDEEEQR